MQRKQTERRPEHAPMPIVKGTSSETVIDGSRYRFGAFMRGGFTAPDKGSKTTFTTYDVLPKPGVSDDEIFAFLKHTLGHFSFPSMMAEYDGHRTLEMFKAAETEGLLVLEVRVAGARVGPPPPYNHNSF